MKQFFEEPKICLEQFAVIDQTLNVSWVIPDTDGDEMNPYGVGAITPAD